MTPRMVLEQFTKNKTAKRNISSNATHEMTESRENRRKVSIRQSM